MNLRDMLRKFRQALLCGAEEKKPSLEISSPTDVRKVALDIPGLTEEQQAFIREKASTDAARLLSLTSHPPTRPPSVTASSLPSQTSSRSPSTTLLNSASSNLPSTLPTPPRQKHYESVPPSSTHTRMKGFWDRTRCMSNTLSTHSHTGYHDLHEVGTDGNESVKLLSLDNQDLKLKDLDLESPVSGKSSMCGFEEQDVVGGIPEMFGFGGGKNEESARRAMMERAVRDTGLGSSSSSSSINNEDTEAAAVAFHEGERKRLVKMA